MFRNLTLAQQMFFFVLSVFLILLVFRILLPDIMIRICSGFILSKRYLWKQEKTS